MRLWFPLFVIAVALITPSTAHVPDTLTVTFLDVGQGDSVLVQAPTGRAMLVDAGESWAAPTVSAGLAAEGIARLKYVVATHEHADHIGGMVGVLPQVTVGQFLTNGVPAITQTATNLRTYLSTHGIPTDAASAGETFALDPANVTVTVLNPPAVPGTDQNEASVVLRLVFGSQSFQLAGDVGTTAEGWMLALGRSVTACFLKVGHHGSSTATGAAFVAAIVRPGDRSDRVMQVTFFRPPEPRCCEAREGTGVEFCSTGANITVRVSASRTVNAVAGAAIYEAERRTAANRLGFRLRLRESEQQSVSLDGRLPAQPSIPAGHPRDGYASEPCEITGSYALWT